MRQSHLVIKTLKEPPKGVTCKSQEFMVRASFIDRIAAGIYTYLPLGFRSLQKLINIIREEFDRVGTQEVLMPTLQPRKIWEDSGRWDTYKDNTFHTFQRTGQEYLLGPTHEEVLTHSLKKIVTSHKQLPVLINQIQNKFRDELRVQCGLLRQREFLMQDAYSFDKDEEGMDESYAKVRKVYQRILDRVGIEYLIVEADVGGMGGLASEEFVLLAETGEDREIICKKCGYAANVELATTIRKTNDKILKEKELKLEKIATHDDKTIDDIVKRFKVPAEKTLKAVFYEIEDQKGNEELIFVVTRGDLEVNDVKLRKTLDAKSVRLAEPEKVKAAGLVAGAASPIGIEKVRVIADNSIKEGRNFIVGANEPGFHFKNSNYPRDFEPDIVADIAVSKEGELCPNCQSPVIQERGIEVGHIFKLGTKYSKALGATYQSEQGQEQLMFMGSYGIGVGRLLAATVEASHDDNGLIWSPELAPFQAHLLALGENTKVVQAAEKLYQDLLDAQIEVLYDDRVEQAGVKFNDADLIGIPIRIVISDKTLKEDSAEFKQRDQKEATMIGLTQTVKEVKTRLRIRA